MNPEAVLITYPSADLKRLLAVTNAALGYSIAKSSDQFPRELHPAEKVLALFASFRDEDAPVGVDSSLFAYVSFSVLVIASEYDMLEAMECAGMPFLVRDTVSRGIQVAVVHGSLNQWRDAVVAGTQRKGPVQQLFCRVMSQFEAANLNVWPQYEKRRDASGSDKLFRLENKRK